LNQFRASDLPEFRAWSQKFDPPADVDAYISQNVGVTAAVAISEIFFPQLIEVRGCILLAHRYQHSNFEDWWTRTAGNRNEIERALNHVHLWDLFEPTGEQEEDALVELARRIAWAWRSWAATLFPKRTFVTAVVDDYGPTVVMHSSVA